MFPFKYILHKKSSYLLYSSPTLHTVAVRLRDTCPDTTIKYFALGWNVKSELRWFSGDTLTLDLEKTLNELK